MIASSSSEDVQGHQHQGAYGGREPRSLVNTFPIQEPRPGRQADNGTAVDFKSVAEANEKGQRCIDKVTKSSFIHFIQLKI